MFLVGIVLNKMLAVSRPESQNYDTQWSLTIAVCGHHAIDDRFGS